MNFCFPHIPHEFIAAKKPVTIRVKWRKKYWERVNSAGKSKVDSLIYRTNLHLRYSLSFKVFSVIFFFETVSICSEKFFLSYSGVNRTSDFSLFYNAFLRIFFQIFLLFLVQKFNIPHIAHKTTAWIFGVLYGIFYDFFLNPCKSDLKSYFPHILDQNVTWFSQIK